MLDAAPLPGAGSAEGVAVHLESGVTDDLDYCRYDGSITTPPRDEPVDWYVMAQPITISADQVDSLFRVSGGPNSRPVQPIGDRSIILHSQPMAG